MESAEGPFVWRRNIDECWSWLLYSRRLDIVKDVARLIAKRYLWDLISVLNGNGVTWWPVQIAAAKSAYLNRLTLVDMPRRAGSTTCIAGLVRALEKTERNISIHIVCSSSRSCVDMMVKIKAIGGLDEYRGNNNECHAMVDLPVLMDPSEKHFIIVMDMDALAESVAHRLMIRTCECPHLKVICFGNATGTGGSAFSGLLHLHREKGEFTLIN